MGIYGLTYSLYHPRGFTNRRWDDYQLLESFTERQFDNYLILCRNCREKVPGGMIESQEQLILENYLDGVKGARLDDRKSRSTDIRKLPLLE